MKNVRWAIFRDETAKLHKKLMINTRGTCYKPHAMGTDTADFIHGKLAFQNVINTWELATNSPATGKDSADCGCRGFVFNCASNMQKPAKLACRGSRYRLRKPRTRNAGTRMSRETILHPQIVDKSGNLLQTRLSYVPVP